MRPDDWITLEPLLNKLLDAPQGERADLLEVLSGGDMARRARLQSLLEECERELPILERSAEQRFDHLLVSDGEVTLPETLSDRYRIERELGHGGMARVYLAKDLKHGRAVAVKVIRPELAASLGRERFLREIAIAARLRHPNIVPLYDSGDANGVLFFVMPYESGQSLRERLDRSKPLPVAEYVSVLRDVARALAYAHGEGVVHRDVKPDNVMLSGGAAVVTDFGIAKAVSVALGATGNDTTLTQTGSGIGTPTYMAPEQAVGDPTTDHRADLYAFGCLAYELISGAPPFHDLSIHQLVAAHVATAPEPLLRMQPEVPEPIARVVMQCLAKDPNDRPQSAQQILEAFDRAGAGAPLNDHSAQRSWNTSPIASTATAPPSRHIPSRRTATVVGALLLAGAGYGAWRARAAGPLGASTELSVAILPMESIGGDSIQRELTEGLTDEVATALVHESGIHVMSRRGVGNYRGKRDLDFATVGRELGARFLVSGELRMLNGTTKVGATLHDASDGSILWKESYVQKRADLDILRDSISHGIADAMRAKFGLRPSAPPIRLARVVDPEAYRRYILGQRALDRRGQSIQASIENFERAIAIDSTYAAAYAGLSLARALLPYFSNVSTDSVAPSARRAAVRALRLDSTQAPAHVALGLVLQHAYQWDSSGNEFRTALRLRMPGDVEPLIQYGRHLMFVGQFRESLQQLLLARQSEPASAVVSSLISYAFFLNGQLDSAMTESEHAYQSDSNNLTTLSLGALVRLARGRRDEAHRFALRAPAALTYNYVLGSLGDTTAVNAALRSSAIVSRTTWMIESARAFAALGTRDTAAALTALDRATDAHEFWPAVPATSAVYSDLHQSPRFRALLQRVGLSDLPVPAAVSATASQSPSLPNPAPRH